MHRPHLLIMDSGIGGLSVTSEIRKQLPHCLITYVADLEWFPYGNKPETELISRVTSLFSRVNRQLRIDIAVIACNTASTVVLDALRAAFTVPFVGVVPAIKPAAALSKTGVIGLLATQGTVNRDYTKALIAEHASHCQVISKGSRRLVELAEAKLQGVPVDHQALAAELDVFNAPAALQLDTVVLACTHFPLLKPELVLCAPYVHHWIDSGEAIARRVVYWTGQLDLHWESDGDVTNRMIVTGKTSPNYRPDLIRDLLGAYELGALPHF